MMNLYFLLLQFVCKVHGSSFNALPPNQAVSTRCAVELPGMKASGQNPTMSKWLISDKTELEKVFCETCIPNLASSNP